MVRVLIDAGHGQGSSFNRGYKGAKWKNEGDAQFHYSLILKKYLEQYGIEVGLTRKNISDNPSLATRGQLAKGYDLFISEHTNAGGGRGVEIYEDVNNRPTRLSNALCAEFARILGTTNRGVKHRYYAGGNYYGVLRNNRAKYGILFEKCFHDNYTEVTKFEEKAEELAKAEARLIAEFFGISKLQTVKEDDIVNKLKVDFVISCNDPKKHQYEVTRVSQYFQFSKLNYVYTDSTKAVDYSNLGIPIIAIGGEKGSHTSYATYFIKGKPAADLFHSSRSNWDKLKI